jgi:hypothetical protein
MLTVHLLSKMKLPLKYRGIIYEIHADASEDLKQLVQRITTIVDDALDIQSVTLVSPSVKSGCKPMKTPDQSIRDAGVCLILVFGCH